MKLLNFSENFKIVLGNYSLLISSCNATFAGFTETVYMDSPA